MPGVKYISLYIPHAQHGILCTIRCYVHQNASAAPPDAIYKYTPPNMLYAPSDIICTARSYIYVPPPCTTTTTTRRHMRHLVSYPSPDVICVIQFHRCRPMSHALLDVKCTVQVHIQLPMSCMHRPVSYMHSDILYMHSTMLYVHRPMSYRLRTVRCHIYIVRCHNMHCAVSYCIVRCHNKHCAMSYMHYLAQLSRVCICVNYCFLLSPIT